MGCRTKALNLIWFRGGGDLGDYFTASGDYRGKGLGCQVGKAMIIADRGFGIAECLLRKFQPNALCSLAPHDHQILQYLLSVDFQVEAIT